MIPRPEEKVATFTDTYGDVREIVRRRGPSSRLQVKRSNITLVDAISVVITTETAKKIKSRRAELGMSQRELCRRAGIDAINAKQRIHAIENGRGCGIRTGTLYALAHALAIDPKDLLPSMDDVLAQAAIIRDGNALVPAKEACA